VKKKIAVLPYIRISTSPDAGNYFQWSDNDLKRIFTPSAWDGGLADYWQRASLRTLDLQGSKIFPWAALNTNSENRDQVASAGIQQALDRQFPLDEYEAFLVFVHPPHVSSGNIPVQVNNRWWNVSVLDAAGEFTFSSHEIGHALGFPHSRDSNNQEYGDPYCIMSAEFFGGQSAVFNLGFNNIGNIPDHFWETAGPFAISCIAL
jgi:hypothetical protein